jgi:hypothetical protein
VEGCCSCDWRAAKAICRLHSLRPEERFASAAEGMDMSFSREFVINKEMLCDVWCRLTVV